MTRQPTALRVVVEGELFEVSVGSNGLASVGDSDRSHMWNVTETGGGTPRTLTLSPGLPDGDREAPGGAHTSARPMRAMVAVSDEVAWVFLEGEVFEIELAEAQQETARRRDRSAHDALAAPMPATVTRILVEAGQHVADGDTLVVLEAMKMEMPIKAPHAGRVAHVRCRAGDLVQPGEPLIELVQDQSSA